MPHHDSPAFLEISYRSDVAWYNGSQCGIRTPGWFVRRTCPCHKGLAVSVRFDTRAEAERCLEVLDEPRNYGPLPP